MVVYTQSTKCYAESLPLPALVPRTLGFKLDQKRQDIPQKVLAILDLPANLPLIETILEL